MQSGSEGKKILHEQVIKVDGWGDSCNKKRKALFLIGKNY